MKANLRLFIVGGLMVAIALGALASPFASGSPDGLERVANDQGFDDTAREHSLSDGPLADYSVPGVQDEKASTGLAGLLGVLLTFGIGMLLFGSLRALRSRSSEPAGSS